MTVRCFTYDAPHHPIDLPGPVASFPFGSWTLHQNLFSKIFAKPLAISEKICYYIQVTWMMTSIKQIGA